MNHSHEHPAAPTLERHCDVAVIGGSAAGLAGALQLVRQQRSVVVVDDGSPRNAPAAHMHGYLGREGVAPSELVTLGREEVRSYGGEVLTGRVLGVRRRDDGLFHVALSGGHALLARRVLAATGITDELPAIDGVAERWGRQVLHCPFCHGYEVRDQSLVQVVTHPMNLHPSAVFAHLAERLTVVVHDGTSVDEQELAALAGAGVAVVHGQVARLTDGPGGTTTVELVDGPPLQADAVVVGTRFRARADLLEPLGLAPTPHPSGMGEVLEVDLTGQTSVPGVYAAGNLTDPSLQVLPSAAHGSRVGSMIAFSLAEEDLGRVAPTSPTALDWDHRYADRMWSANPNGTLVAEAADLPPGRALDVGGGEGADALWLAERGWTATATDISGVALSRIAAEAARRDVEVGCVRADATGVDPFGAEVYDLVSLQYGSFHRSPDQRGLRNLLGAVAPGGTLLVVGHDLAPLDQPVDVAEQTRMFDPGAYVGVEEIAAVIADDPDWTVEVHETRPRPPGAASTHHVDDVVLRATRRTT